MCLSFNETNLRQKHYHMIFFFYVFNIILTLNTSKKYSSNKIYDKALSKNCLTTEGSKMLIVNILDPSVVLRKINKAPSHRPS